MLPAVGITKLAHHLPEGRLTSADLAGLTGLDVGAIETEWGIREKRVGERGESALDHAIRAGQKLLEGIDPASVDLLIYASGSMTDYPLWWGIYKLHDCLGLSHARFLELHYGCIGSLHALEAAKCYLQANPRIKRAIVIGAEGYHFDPAFPNYGQASNEPMFIFADGAAAALLESERTVTLPNVLGEFAFLVDASLNGDVPIPAGGAKRFTSAETVAAGEHVLQMASVEAKDLRRFGLRYIANYLAVIREALAAGGYERKNPDFVISNQLKPALMRIVMAKLGLTMAETAYTMPHWGHVGTADILLCLGAALEAGQLKRGDVATIVSSGVSFSWGAATLEIR